MRPSDPAVLSGSSRCDALPEELIDDVSDVAGNLGEEQTWKAMENTEITPLKMGAYEDP